MSKLKKALGVNPDVMRIREFELNGQKLRVRVPLTAEAEQIFERTKEPPADSVEVKFKEITTPLYENKESLQSEEIVITENDVVVQGKSMRELAKTKAATEMRIVETFKLLVPLDNTSFDDLTYDEINEEFPLPIQLSIVKKITEIIAPNYEESRKN